MKKKIITFLLTLSLSTAAVMPTVAFAATPGVGDGSVSWSRTGNTTEDFGLSLKYEESLKPSYSIKVPQTLNMQEDGTDVYVTVSNTKNLASNNKYISVKVKDTWATNFPKNYKDDDHKYSLYCGYDFMKYSIQPKLTDGSYGDALTDFNQELLSFTEDGTKYYRVTPLEDTKTADKPYWWGNINFTVSVDSLPQK